MLREPGTTRTFRQGSNRAFRSFQPTHEELDETIDPFGSVIPFPGEIPSPCMRQSLIVP